MSVLSWIGAENFLKVCGQSFVSVKNGLKITLRKKLVYRNIALMSEG